MPKMTHLTVHGCEFMVWRWGKVGKPSRFKTILPPFHYFKFPHLFPPSSFCLWLRGFTSTPHSIPIEICFEELFAIGHGASSEAASFMALHCAAASFMDDLGVVPSLICGHGLAGKLAAFTVAGVLQPIDCIKVAQGCDELNAFWPPTIPLTCQKGLLSERPTSQYLQSLKRNNLDDQSGLMSAVQSLQCDVVLEICLGVPAVESIFSKSTIKVVAASLGAPSDGRIVSADVVERAVLEAAAALHSNGVALTFTGALGAGPIARLPPTSLTPKICWPCDPTNGEWTRDDLYEDIYQARWLTSMTRPNMPNEKQSKVQQFLVTGGDAALQLASVLSQRGCAAKVGSPSALPLEMSLAPTTFVFILELPKVHQLQQTLDCARAEPHAMLQWLRGLPRKGPCKAVILCVGAHGSQIDLRYIPVAAMWGAARSARQELRSDLLLRCIDFDPVCLESESFKRSEIFKCFADEITFYPEEMRDVLLAPSVRKVEVLESLQLPLETSTTDSIDRLSNLPKTFGITGGTGALGLMLSEWLAFHGAKSLVLASRSGKVPEENSKLWSTLSQSQASLELCKCDVSQDPSPLVQLLQSADAFGVAHLAGVLHDGLFAHQSFSTLDMTMKPKVDGAALLVEMLRSPGTEHCARRLQQMWLFSSVTSCLGNMGQTAYGAANSALDSMSRAWWPGHELGPTAGATLSLQWGPWADFGMASALPSGSTSIFRPWKGTQAMQALKATLAAKSCPVLCLTQFEWPQVRQDLGESPYYQGFLQSVWGEKSKDAKAAKASPVGRQSQDIEDVKSAVVQTLQKFLPNGSDGLTDDVEFDELGLDSLSGVEASRSLAVALAPFGVKSVKPTFLFEANCLKAVLAKIEVTKVPPTDPVTSVTPLPQAVQEAPQASWEDIKQIVIDSLSRFLPNGRDGLTETVEFDELGLDSLSGVEASRALAAALHAHGFAGIKPTFLFEANSVGSVLSKTLVCNQKAKQYALQTVIF